MENRSFSAPFNCREKGIVSCAECANAGCKARITPSAPPSVGATSPAPRPLPPPMYAPRAASRAPSADAASRARGGAESQARSFGEVLADVWAELSAPSVAPAQGIRERPAHPAPIEAAPSAPPPSEADLPPPAERVEEPQASTPCGGMECARCPERPPANALATPRPALVERALNLIGKWDERERRAQGGLLCRHGRARYACALRYCAEAWAEKPPRSRPRLFNWVLAHGDLRGRGE